MPTSSALNTSASTQKNKPIWFIADLHLDPSRPQLLTLFYDFIDKIQGQAHALYILGDLFEVWIGDDIIDLPEGEAYLPVINKLKSLSDSGTSLYFIQGNRDFLVKETFCQRIGARLLPDKKVIQLFGTPALIMHGDTLCTDDKGYQRLRYLLRLRIVQWFYLSLSPKSRAEKALKIRELSQQKTQAKEAMILDVNQHTVEKEMLKENVTVLIHGHTHRPAEHRVELKNKGEEGRRIVLGDWQTHPCYLKVDRAGFHAVF